MIKLDEDWYISADSNNYILQKKVLNNKTGKEEFKSEKFGSTITSMIKSYMKIKSREYVSKARQTSLENAIKKIEEIEKRIETVTREK